MEKPHEFKLILGSISAFLLLVLFLIAYILRRKPSREESVEVRNSKHVEEFEAEDLIGFPGGEDLTVHDILDAPGEVVGKSSYGTLYQASLQRSGSVVLLQFLRPACAGRANDVLPAIRMMGFIRHSNLVPLQAFYVGPRGEKLLVHPFVSRSTLSQFLHELHAESQISLIERLSWSQFRAFVPDATGARYLVPFPQQLSPPDSKFPLRSQLLSFLTPM